jgi:oxygen-independent coproporphyrinogen-3 oxidase
MTLEEGTPLGKMKAAGRVRAIGERWETAFFVFTSRYLEKHGYRHYEISNFAGSPECKCRHNRKYWSHVPYLGLGPSAHSFQAGSRWWNVRSIKKYCQLLAEGKAPVEACEALSQEQLVLEVLALGFRTSDGVALPAFGDRLPLGKALEELQKSNLVKVNNGRIQPTRKGFLVADSLPLIFYSSTCH